MSYLIWVVTTMVFSALNGSALLFVAMLESRRADRRFDGENERIRARCLKILIPVAKYMDMVAETQTLSGVSSRSD